MKTHLCDFGSLFTQVLQMAVWVQVSFCHLYPFLGKARGLLLSDMCMSITTLCLWIPCNFSFCETFWVCLQTLQM